MMNHQQLIKSLIPLCQQAGAAIMQVYEHKDFAIDTKQDQSPVTSADLAAHEIIQQGLLALTPNIPQLSEEGKAVSFKQRQQWNRFWCIDPLDGTKEFIQGNDEFTVNIALIENNKPVLGIIYVPVSKTCYWGSTQLQAKKQINGQHSIHIRSRPLGQELVIAASRRHGEDNNDGLLKQLYKHFRHVHNHAMGSSLKMCLIAEGVADFYPRLYPTSEWDTAAAQAIVEAAGGRLVNATNLQPLAYNEQESLENPFFYVCGDPQFPLEEITLRDKTMSI
ncbi:3'(2'),5'-bisphosphate nucleotidase CysQ [Neptuniibacter marinus]|uniref:3'(2'),5'-bisphosphate nucleotidase CysQ n=1 Tax=Neptuniibacter marinus TaxID=1806670 RepID=UPI000A896B82|nr:3'(2'),5'-bisphosphate nucleotidase CysQ [Neptuniibacter marinus]